MIHIGVAVVEADSVAGYGPWAAAAAVAVVVVVNWQVKVAAYPTPAHGRGSRSSGIRPSQEACSLRPDFQINETTELCILTGVWGKPFQQTGEQQRTMFPWRMDSERDSPCGE